MGANRGVATHREVGEAETVSNEVVMAVSEARGIAPTDLDPLAETVDCDALNDLHESMDPGGSISFQYAGFDVVVGGNGLVLAQEQDE